MRVIFGSKFGPPLITLVLLVGLLEGLVQTGIIHEFIFPAPSQIVQVLIHDTDTLLPAMWSTFYCATAGYLLSGVVGVFLAVLFSLSDFLRKSIFPYAIFLQTVPIIAIAPLLVIW